MCNVKSDMPALEAEEKFKIIISPAVEAKKFTQLLQGGESLFFIMP